MPYEDDIPYEMPSSIRETLTKELMTAFRDNVIQYYTQEDLRKGKKPTDYTEETYYSWWAHIDHSFNGFFVKTTKEYELDFVNEYYQALDWYDADSFDGILGGLLIKYELVKLGEPLEEENEEVFAD